MNRRDQELLSRQMSRFQPPAPGGSMLMLVLVIVFLAGMTVGNVLSLASHHGQQPSDDGRTALAFLLSGVQKAAQ
jgi:hypothetical protein